MKKFIILFLSIYISSAYANDQCLVVKGFNLCEDAKIIADNSKKDIGVKRIGTEYILKSVTSNGMTVISVHESIYTKEEVNNNLRKAIEQSGSKNFTIDDLSQILIDQSTERLCQIYNADVFVKDGGSFKVSYAYKNGEIFHTVLALKNNCKAVIQ